MSVLQVEAGVHNAVHARAERIDRTILSELERGMRVAAQLWKFRGSKREDKGMDKVVQRGEAASGIELSKPGRLQATTIIGGLIFGEHYTFSAEATISATVADLEYDGPVGFV